VSQVVAQITKGTAAPPPRELPHSIEAEQSLLGACLVNTEAYDGVDGLVSADDFFDPVHARMFEVVAAAREAGQRMSPTLMTAAFGDEAATLIQPGKTLSWYFATLASEATTIIGVADYARVIRHLADCRRLIDAGRLAADAAHGGMAVSPAAIATVAIDAFDAVASGGATETIQAMTIGEATASALERAEAIADGGGKSFDVPWGLRSLNAKTYGMECGELVVVGGRPGMGKTAFGLAVSLMAAGSGVGSTFMSMEMKGQQLGQRALAWHAYGKTSISVPYTDIRAGRFDADQREALRRAKEHTDALPIVIEQEGRLTIGQILARARKHKVAMARRGVALKLLVVDHLAIIKPSDRYHGNRVHEVTEFTGALKAGAKELDMVVLLLAQLNRANESLDDKRPTLSSFRDSGSIEQDADIVLGLYREEYYLKNIKFRDDAQNELMQRVQNRMEMLFLKQRQGSPGLVEIFCSIAHNHFAELQDVPAWAQVPRTDPIDF
jgi:replicative DNA helicase